MRLSKKQLDTLRKLKKSGPANARDLQCSISTLQALARRKMVTVETTFDSIAFPQKATAYITDAGRTAAFQS